ncbi:MAG: protein GumC [Desulfobacteraceae bacterium]|nr:protein GumC [Desulfobacteraceae bacterium]MBC2749238.1 protein GumC [Desulfobacteraceae bacterium]
MQIENPLQQEFLKPEFIIDTLIRRRWIVIIPFILALAVGSYLAVTLPKIYEAETLILVEPQRVPTNYVQSVVSNEEVEARINTLSQQILSRTNLEKIINQFNLYADPQFEGMFTEDKVNALRKNITVQTTTSRRETNAFSITYRGKDPQKVMDVTNTLATYFIDENLKVREAQAIGTSDFLEAELVSMRRRLEEQERALEAYRTSNMGELPEQLETNLRILDRLQEQLTERQEGLRDARSRLAMLRNQASTGLLTDQTAAGDTSPREPDPLDPAALQAELARLQSRYTDKHPDIIKIKQQLKDLEANGTTSAAEAPTTRREPVQITDVRREIENTTADIGRIQSEIMTYERRVESTPKREQELMALQRDYENLQESYSSLLNRKLEADISVNMERKQKGEQFRVLDQARLPKRPVEPNMQMLFLITIAAGLGMGGGIIFLLEYMNAGFRSPKEVELTLGLPMIALLPFIEDSKTRMVKMLNWVATGVAVAAAGIMLVVFASLALKGVEESLALVSKVKNLIL